MYLPFLIIFTCISSLFAHNHSSGSTQYGKEVIETIDASGLLKLDGTSITNHLQMKGSIIAKNAQIGSFHVMGEANLKDTLIKSASTMMCYLQASQTTFQGPLTILSQKVVLTASKVDRITFQKDLSYKGKQILELRQGTIVNGPVHFESGKGEVWIYPSSQILGDVTGGTILKKS